MPALGGVGNAIAGGSVLDGSPLATVNDMDIVILGSNVKKHGKNEHSGPVMTEAHQSVTSGDIPVCVLGNHASCGHVMFCTTNVEVG